MAILNTKLADIDASLATLRERAMQLRQLQRALERVGSAVLAEEIGDLADAIIDESKLIETCVSIVVSDLVASPKTMSAPAPEQVCADA